VSAITIVPSGATETLLGVLRLALVAAMPLPKLPAIPLPAIVVITPPADTIRIRLSLESLITKPPPGMTSTPFGAFSRAAVAAPPSPQAPVGAGQTRPVPATRVITPFAATMRTLLPWSSMSRNPPPGSGTTRSGALSSAAAARPPSPHASAGFAHILPVPATVVMIPLAKT
jgi:hypothetical protein